MKRREFLSDALGALSLTVPFIARSETKPCPPPLVSSGSQQVTSSCAGSALERVANSLSAGQSATLGDTGLAFEASYAIQWVNRFYYDDQRKRAYLLGKKEGGGANTYWLMRYEESSNSWSYAGSGNELGHVYESIGFDPATGELYTGNWYSDRLKKITPNAGLTAWTNPATSALGTTFTQDIQPALAWHPNLFGGGDGGIVALSGRSSAGKVVAWRKSTNSWHDVAGTSWTTSDGSAAAYTGAVLHVRGGDFCVATASPSLGGKTFVIPAGSDGSLGSASQVANVPVACTYANGYGQVVGMLIDDPTGDPTPYILEKGGSNRVWRYSAGKWIAQSFQHPFPNGSSDSSYTWAVASCYPFGVMWCRSASTSNSSRLWRPNDL
jgi:hypothetical protein